MMGTMARTPFRAIAISVALSPVGAGLRAGQRAYEADPPDRARRGSATSRAMSRCSRPAKKNGRRPSLNRPLTTGDKLWTEHDARAEISRRTGGRPAGQRHGLLISQCRRRHDPDAHDRGRHQREACARSTATSRSRSTRRMSRCRCCVAGNYRVEVNDAGDTTVVKVSEGAAQVTGPSQDTSSCMPSKLSRSRASMISSRSSARWARPTSSIHGAWSAIDATITRRLRGPPSTCRPTSRATRISTTTARGVRNPSTDTCGRRGTSRVDWAPYRYGRWVWISPWG